VRALAALAKVLAGCAAPGVPRRRRWSPAWLARARRTSTIRRRARRSWRAD
jgi:hypothetical protein